MCPRVAPSGHGRPGLTPYRAGMRRSASVLPALLALTVLTGCSSQEEMEVAAPTPEARTAGPSVSAAPAAPDIEGLEVLAEDPSHEHREGRIEYERVPPPGGPHHPRWLACDVYTEPVPTELAVHSLEHGAVWLAYKPDLTADQVEQLAQLATANPEYVLVSPQPGLDSRVVAVTWGAALEASSADDPRLAAFVERYAGGGQGGEPGLPCRGSGLTPEQARALLGGQSA